jgi:hypothetical protein
MASFSRPYSSPSPVLIVSPQAAHQPTFDMANYSHESELGHSALFGHSTSVRPQPPSSYQIHQAAGRKRSRDEAAINLNDDGPEMPPILPIRESEEEWIYGEGMVLIKPNSGYVADASSQSGTWVEEKSNAEQIQQAALISAQQQQQQQQQQHRPSLRSHKSQRLEQTASSSPGQDSGITSGSSVVGMQQPIGVSSTLPADNLSPPVVDDFTLHLGIGWRKISEDEHIQAAARGWAKFIENHYPLSSVRIVLESKGLQSYLVEAVQGYFLLSENLKQARLVSTAATTALTNLKSSPPIFDGIDVLIAAESSRDFEHNFSAPKSHSIFQPQPRIDTEMDMS